MEKDNESAFQDNISLKEYFLSLLKERKDEFENRFIAMDRAIGIATTSLDKRLDGMNEFRATLKDQGNTFVTKAEYQGRYDELSKQVEDLRLSRATLEGKASAKSVYVAYVISGISLLLGIVSLLEKLMN
jgi:hypothetical protein